MESIRLSWNAKRKAWYKWHPDHKKTVFVAGDVPIEEATRAWLRLKNGPSLAVVRTRRLRQSPSSLGELVNRYLAERRQDVDSGDCTLSHFDGMSRALAHLVRYFGRSKTIDDLTPDDWTRYARELHKFQPSSRRRIRAIIKKMFTQAEADDWIDRMPKFGTKFKELSNVRETKPIAPFSRSDCQRLLAEIDDILRQERKSGDGSWRLPYLNLKAAFMLGLNGGLTPADFAHLKTSELDIQRAVIEHQRNKTGVPRVIPLWPETIRAVTAATAFRPQSASALLLLTKHGRPLAHQSIGAHGRVNLCDSISNLFRDVAKRVGVSTSGKGLSRLRHTCRSVASESGDETAADIIAGHRLPGMRRVYITVTEHRLRKAAGYVHDWLFTPHTLLDDQQPVC